MMALAGWDPHMQVCAATDESPFIMQLINTAYQGKKPYY